MTELRYSDRLIKLRESLGLNIASFARELDVPRSTLVGWEEGKTVSISVLKILEEKFQINLEWFLTGEGEMFVSPKVHAKEEKHPLVKDMEVLINESVGGRVDALETRLAALEFSFKKLEGPEPNPAPEGEYPAEEPGGGYTAEPEPDYGESAGPVAFLEQIAAGPPIDQADDEGLVVDVPLRYIKTGLGDYYALRIRGNSMIDALIPDGSMVLIRKSDTPVNGAIQVVSVDGQATLKRLREGEDHSWTACYEDGSGRTVAMGEGLRVQGDFAAVLPPSTRPRMRGGE
jgi:SOS-response transcriptional repressor LexA